jgi:hypothetical protein
VVSLSNHQGKQAAGRRARQRVFPAALVILGQHRPLTGIFDKRLQRPPAEGLSLEGGPFDRPSW